MGPSPAFMYVCHIIFFPLQGPITCLTSCACITCMFKNDFRKISSNQVLRSYCFAFLQILPIVQTTHSQCQKFPQETSQRAQPSSNRSAHSAIKSITAASTSRAPTWWACMAARQGRPPTSLTPMQIRIKVIIDENEIDAVINHCWWKRFWDSYAALFRNKRVTIA